MILRITATVAFALTLLVNALANILPINNLNTGEVSQLYPSLFTPAGLTFSIWSVIYLLLIGFIVLSWVHRNEKYLEALFPWFILSCALNMSWILAWHYLYTGLSVIIMFGLLFSLVKLFLQVRKNVPRKPVLVVLVYLPFTIYFAWICVASIANVSALLVDVNWDAMQIPQEVWAVIMMIVAAVLAVIILFRYNTPAFVLVVIWALVGIYLRWNNSDYNMIQAASIVLVAVLAVASIIVASKTKTLV